MSHRDLTHRLAVLCLLACACLFTMAATGRLWPAVATVILLGCWALAGLLWGSPEEDAYCSHVDEQWERQERAARAALRSSHNVVALPTRPPAEVIDLLTRERRDG